MHQQRLIWLLAASFWMSQASLAQQVQPLAATDDAPELIGGQPQASSSVDLGQTNSTVRRSTAATGAPGTTTVAGMSLPAPLATAGTARAAAARAQLRPVPAAPVSGPIERAVFAREPVRVSLEVDQERLITLPADALLHVPNDMDAVARIESIGGTIYVTALVAFEPIRIIAEHARANVRRECPQVLDVLVHIDPEDDQLAHAALGDIDLSRERLEAWLATESARVWGHSALAPEQVQLHYLNGQVEVEVMLPPAPNDLPEPQAIEDGVRDLQKAAIAAGLPLQRWTVYRRLSGEGSGGAPH